MAQFWASRNPIPAVSEHEATSREYLGLCDLKADAMGLSLKQGQADIFGAIEMLGALQYHYQQFIRVRDKKIAGEIKLDAPDQRFEAVAYITRIGQFCYFADSDFSKTLVGVSDVNQIPSIKKLVPFRHKYAAHRARDKPKNADEQNDLWGDLALGALGGDLSVERQPGFFESLVPIRESNWDDYRRREYEGCFVLYEINSSQGRVVFNLEVDHGRIFEEASAFMRKLVNEAKRLPRG